jgi:hypothetical protein
LIFTLCFYLIGFGNDFLDFWHQNHTMNTKSNKRNYYKT